MFFLLQLTGINDKMAEYTNSAGVPSLNAALMHTLQRHRDILQVTDRPLPAFMFIIWLKLVLLSVLVSLHAGGVNATDSISLSFSPGTR